MHFCGGGPLSIARIFRQDWIGGSSPSPPIAEQPGNNSDCDPAWPRSPGAGSGLESSWKVVIWRSVEAVVGSRGSRSWQVVPCLTDLRRLATYVATLELSENAARIAGRWMLRLTYLGSATSRSLACQRGRRSPLGELVTLALVEQVLGIGR